MINIDGKKFVEVQDTAFRSLEKIFSDEYMRLIESITSGKVTAEHLHSFYESVFNSISDCEESIFNFLSLTASKEVMKEIFESNTEQVKK
ncbi:MAG: hypothetical protein BWY23_00238 [Spirochaetes bacterium ADurb.Bin218]|nr:MAG: hypothetical protein BWY23_00238 [Spirochaetes bacterium ADurb.Bin218]